MLEERTYWKICSGPIHPAGGPWPPYRTAVTALLKLCSRTIVSFKFSLSYYILYNVNLKSQIHCWVLWKLKTHKTHFCILIQAFIWLNAIARVGDWVLQDRYCPGQDSSCRSLVTGLYGKISQSAAATLLIRITEYEIFVPQHSSEWTSSYYLHT